MLHQVLGRSSKQDQQLGHKKSSKNYQLSNVVISKKIKCYSISIVVNHSKSLCKRKPPRATQSKCRKHISPKETLINWEVFGHLKY